MTKDRKVSALKKCCQQLTDLTLLGYRISIESDQSGFDIIASWTDLQHSHYTGDTLAEAVNRAYKSLERDYHKRLW